MSTRDGAFARLLAESYATLVGVPLIPPATSDEEAADWLYEAPFGLLAHDTSPDPLFVYANRTAQEHFGYCWHEFVGLPSRMSAGESDRDERASFMDAVRQESYAVGYRGPRVARGGRRFWIDDATVWNLVGADGVAAGQAALIRSWAES